MTAKDDQSIDMLRAEFIARGYQCDEVLRSNIKYFRFSRSEGWYWLARVGNVSYPFVTRAASHISSHKDLTYAVVEQLGIPVPPTIVVNNQTDERVLDNFLAAHKRLVVKPIRGQGSQGVYLNITEPRALREAVAASKTQLPILVQKQCSGTEVRCTIYKGKMLSVIEKRTACVIGDSTSTLSQLISAENNARKLLNFSCLPYPQLQSPLVAESLVKSQYIPHAAETITLSASTMVGSGASLYCIADDLHYTYHDAVSRIAHHISPDFLVVDMLIDDYTQPATTSNYVFLESNTSPSLKLYYAVRNRRFVDIIPLLVDGIIENRSRSLASGRT